MKQAKDVYDAYDPYEGTWRDFTACDVERLRLVWELLAMLFALAPWVIVIAELGTYVY